MGRSICDNHHGKSILRLEGIESLCEFSVSVYLALHLHRSRTEIRLWQAYTRAQPGADFEDYPVPILVRSLICDVNGYNQAFALVPVSAGFPKALVQLSIHSDCFDSCCWLGLLHVVHMLVSLLSCPIRLVEWHSERLLWHRFTKSACCCEYDPGPFCDKCVLGHYCLWLSIPTAVPPYWTIFIKRDTSSILDRTLVCALLGSDQ